MHFCDFLSGRFDMLVSMSDKELKRLSVLQDVRDHRITQVRAAEILNLSTRQITRLLQKLNQDGISGMMHTSRGQHISCALDPPWRMRSSAAYFINIPVETLRRWMTANELWIPRSKRLKRPYQPRYNRDCFGELIQIDGSEPYRVCRRQAFLRISKEAQE